jgi:hypothetical protein
MQPPRLDRSAELLDAARALEPLVRSLSDRFDRDRQLPHELAQALGEARLFSMWLPLAPCGAEFPPIPFLEVIEELSRQDGSVGWCTVIPAGYGRLAGAMPLDAASESFGSGRAVLVGTLNPTGKAAAVPGGYRVTGRWGYGSFIAHSQWVLGNCVTDDGGPPFRLCIVPRTEVEVFDIWHVGGLRGTGRLLLHRPVRAARTRRSAGGILAAARSARGAVCRADERHLYQLHRHRRAGHRPRGDRGIDRNRCSQDSDGFGVGIARQTAGAGRSGAGGGIGAVSAGVSVR